MAARIFHLVTAKEWEQVGELYAPGSLATEGFIHCSAAGQVPRVAAALFAGRTDLLLVELDPDRCEAPVIWEDCYEAGEVFPHLYGPLPRRAVRDVRPYLPGDDGRFPPLVER